MAKFFALLAAFAVIAQVSLACPPYHRCGCGSKVAQLEGLVGLSAVPVSFGSAVAEDIVGVETPIERTEIVSSPISNIWNPTGGIFRHSPYYSRGCSHGARYRTAILPPASSC